MHYRKRSGEYVPRYCLPLRYRMLSPGDSQKERGSLLKWALERNDGLQKWNHSLTIGGTSNSALPLCLRSSGNNG